MYRAFRKKALGSLILSNAFIKTATFEGMYKNGIPTQALIDHHVSMAKGGVALTTVSYGAVSADVRTFEHQMYINERSLVKLQKLTSAVHEAGGKLSIQLTHCGYFSKNKAQKRPLAPSRIFNEYGCLSGIVFSKAMNQEDLERVASDFATAAAALKSVGFDAVELHMGHGYLLSQFLSPWTNRRKDNYGGSIENRARYPLEVLKAIKKKVGTAFPVLVKLNLSDGFKGGFSLEDCIYVCRQLEQTACEAVILSGGFTSKTPFYLMRGAVPLKGLIQNSNSWAERITMAFFGPLIIKKYPYTSNFFLKQASLVRQAVSIPLVYLGGVDSKKGIEQIMDAGFDFIAIGRALIHDADFLKKLEAGTLIESGCNRCNQCVVEMDREGISCVL